MKHFILPRKHIFLEFLFFFDFLFVGLDGGVVLDGFEYALRAEVLDRALGVNSPVQHAYKIEGAGKSKFDVVGHQNLEIAQGSTVMHTLTISRHGLTTAGRAGGAHIGTVKCDCPN